MAKIYGNIGSFSELIKEIDEIYQPSSLVDIAEFKKNFPGKPLQIKERNKKEILDEIDNLKNKLKELSGEYDGNLKKIEELLIKEKSDIESKISIYSIKPSNIFVKIYYRFKLKKLLITRRPNR